MHTAICDGGGLRLASADACEDAMIGIGEILVIMTCGALVVAAALVPFNGVPQVPSAINWALSSAIAISVVFVLVTMTIGIHMPVDRFIAQYTGQAYIPDNGAALSIPVLGPRRRLCLCPCP